MSDAPRACRVHVFVHVDCAEARALVCVCLLADGDILYYATGIEVEPTPPEPPAGKKK